MDKKDFLMGRKRISELGAPQAMVDKKAELQALLSETQAATGVESAPAKPVVVPDVVPSNNELSAEAIAEMLTDLYEKLSQAGDRNRCRYTPQMRINELMAALRDILRDKEKRNQDKGMSVTENLSSCQRFIQDILKHLSRQGIVLNAMSVVVQE